MRPPNCWERPKSSRIRIGHAWFFRIILKPIRKPSRSPALRSRKRSKSEVIDCNSRAYETLLRVEREIRAFITVVMSQAFGADWTRHQLPLKMFDNWKEKKQKGIVTGRRGSPAHEYADFTGCKAIIERSDNWKQVLKPIFGRPEDIRKSTMHARFITLDDDLLLRAETTRVLNRLRRYMN